MAINTIKYTIDNKNNQKLNISFNECMGDT